MRKIICVGPGPMFKGGISNYNTSLAKALDSEPNTEVHILSWTEQYPRIIPRKFKDTSSKKKLLEDTKINIEYLLDFNKPSTWKKMVERILDINPQLVVIQWSIAIQGIPLSYIAKKLKKYKNIEVIGDLHFIIQKEGSLLDSFLTRRALSSMGTYITHSLKTVNELDFLFNKKHLLAGEFGDRRINKHQTINLFHPVYKLFESNPSFDVQRFKNKLGLKKHVFLFFGFIRKYKGLHNVIPAFHKLQQERDDVSLLICGEDFWNTVDNKKLSVKIKKLIFGIAKKVFLRTKNDEKDYKPLQLIVDLGVKNCHVFSEFIPNEDVNKYFQVSDAILLFYEYATPSGIESLSYNFRLPALATKVGHFPETINDGFDGYLAEEGSINSMTEVMNKSIEKPINKKEIDYKTIKMSWENYAKAILKPYNV
jgi:glycosyltransferase involved in cell wall biosynthesis|tara:strand:+ start:1169 stop:2440 length:1272 start_codon:yes stop_codon:yes gene_type:complete